MHLKMFQMDAKLTFLNKELEVEIYMDHMEGYEHISPPPLSAS